ncbi:hypothetical protein BJY52DRAFT_1419723 [Lactarius psammicola]|nr:hypothetical protein BJY52DRAFT_1419723 [Lactarius psammicola]
MAVRDDVYWKGISPSSCVARILLVTAITDMADSAHEIGSRALRRSWDARHPSEKVRASTPRMRRAHLRLAETWQGFPALKDRAPKRRAQCPKGADTPHTWKRKLPGGLPKFNQAVLARLEAMGSPLVRCLKAFLAAGHSGREAVERFYAHMEDPDIGCPIAIAQSTSGGGPSLVRRKWACLRSSGSDYITYGDTPYLADLCL